MNISKLLDGVKNISQVYEGVKNKIFKREYIEAIADSRWQICKSCDELDLNGKNCAAPGTQPCCTNCGCSLAYKTRSLAAACPKNKWKELMSEDEEKALFEQLTENETKQRNKSL